MIRTRLTPAVAMLTAFAAPAAAQEALPPSPNAEYVELLGNGVLYSINYDRHLTRHLTGRVGLSALAATRNDGGESSAVVATPVMVNYLFGEGNHHLETGVGVVQIAGAVDEVEDEVDESFSGATGTATIGYRFLSAPRAGSSSGRGSHRSSAREASGRGSARARGGRSELGADQAGRWRTVCSAWP